MIPSTYVAYLAPEILLTIWAMGLLLAEAFLSLSPRAFAVWALGGIAIAAVITLCIATDSTPLLFWGGVSKWEED